MIDDIKNLIESQQQLAQQAYIAYLPEVENIIKNEIVNNNTIELLLDYMLDFCFDDRMLSLFKKLCRYYWDINPQATANYVNYYRERWDSDSLIDTKDADK
jgi:hypothetical protein